MNEESTQPNADAAELERFAAMAAQWWDPNGPNRPLHAMNPVRVRYIAERAGGLAGRNCLDVGCGGGLLSEALAIEGAESVLGLDASAEMLEVARLHAEAGSLKNLEYRLGAAEELEGEFDVVCCLEVLEHVPRPGELLAECARLTRPGGHVFVSTLNRTLAAFALGIVSAEYVLGLLPRGTHRYEKFIRPSELEAWARAAGLSARDFTGLQYNPLHGSFRRSSNIDVNYIAHFTRTAGA
ncbi:MAG: bifunctional 2-polyprenyl-6-hydroxyphenol methylase/3-demethylubiquinol 3-O-methyltransferase UbiG [Gammaproteobacteria bacterium]|nr:bifunctional 2-polyprenyl-6-hydroxyphenol methylase/3-demethylubiquinol 3-O-methyltransferase UbiG [Gammaproteobacteria bacterium]MXW45440.1 bifunctional 2-polyprenyl-6-hydroxyphenol methylase/3-demethylubiquinol 3-O-methyltransferase UbiG [Gammaproteobacteria bacterium]MYD01294.1 bifunctional 2-polyprenyl-6-hydroxyphenol methylase/3-demethylubiquinol 3-O-methyltransferase UbiG [Gammaproteobacteria bacterium]MYI25098.1 bifunctional 2-polyprenyl-6-hydroxyphenol methylase/3-demethylubiquinol 3-